MPFTITKHRVQEEYTLAVKTWGFPGGERGVKLDSTNLRYTFCRAPYQTITARLQSSADVMDLLMVVDALRRLDPDTPVRLFLPYLPYARQDRVCVPGEAHSLRVFATLINGLGFDRVTVVDPHSDVSGAVLDRLHIITQQQVIGAFAALNRRLLGEGFHFTLVSPDAGAAKKTSSLAAYFGHQDIVRADKRRNLATGEILETVIHSGDLAGQSMVIVDDLCDGGRTFIELARALRAKGAGKVILMVTHGIFSKGTKPLFEAGIDEIYSTDSFYDVWPGEVQGVTTLRLEEAFSQ